MRETKQIRTVEVRCNNRDRSQKIAASLQQQLEKRGYILTNHHPDLCIAIGGDGAFLRMVREASFNPDMLFIGIHTGTLGFLQEVSPREIPAFLDYLDQGQLDIGSMDVLHAVIYTDQRQVELDALNEFVVRSQTLKTVHLSVYIDNTFLEEFSGDGLLISSSAGSSAYNMSFGGALVDNTFATMQITPMAPLKNLAYHTLMNSFIMPDTRTISLLPSKPAVLITADGDSTRLSSVSKLIIRTREKPIRRLRFRGADFVSKIQDKLL